MAAKARKPASAATKSTSTVGSNSTTPALAPIVTNKLAQSASFTSYSPQQSNLVKDSALGPPPAGNQVHVGADHRPNQPFQGAAPVRPVQQSPNLSGGQQNQQSYAVQGVFSPQPALQSPYQHTPPLYQPQQTPTENSYYSSNPSPRSTHSSAYYTAEKSENMAAATAAMQRPYHQTYHTPQSNSPASVTSPQTHDPSRQMFQPHGQMTPNMYYHHQYTSMTHPTQQPMYGHTAPAPMNPPPLVTYQPHTASMPLPQIPSQVNTIQSSPSLKSESIQRYTPSTQPPLPQRHSSTPVSQHLPMNQSPAPPSTSNAAPGPIPATTPLVVHQDSNGVQWIAFEYSRDRVKLEYTIRCDVESIDTSSLTQEFKGENCVYPRACVPKEQYKGNRLSYETECNQVGWALAELNACLRGKRGLIQRAVDSWRNSNRDPKLRSRRVRRQAKLHNRTKMAASSAAQSGPAAGLASSNPLGGLNQRPGASLPSNSQQMQHHHHAQHDSSPTAQDSVTASAYGTTPNLQRAPSNSQHLTSPNQLRQAQAFPGYQPYPTGPSSMGSSMAPPIHGSMHHYGRPSGSGSMLSGGTDTDDHNENNLFGEIPEGKRRKFILVDDAQNSAKVRVKVKLDQIDTSEIPDSYRKHNSLYPRSYSPVQLQSATQSTNGGYFVEDDIETVDDLPPIAGRVTVPCQLTSSEGEIEISQLSGERRSRERKINELGYRMAWGQSRVFSVDVYRTKQRAALQGVDPDDAAIPEHLETRPGKRRWLERMRSNQGINVPTPHPA